MIHREAYGKLDRLDMSDTPNKQPVTALIVDDDALLLHFLTKRLSSWGYAAVTALNGQAGAQAIESAAPDVVIADLYMPEGDGFALLREVRESRPNLPIIIMSGQGKLQDAIQALRLGAWDYITKPIEEMGFLRMAIERVLEKARLVNENRAYRDHLEDLVAQKSAELLRQQQALMEKTVRLEETNAALKHLLDQREIEKKAIEQTMVSNLKRFVLPYLDELDALSLDNGPQAYLSIIRTNIDQLISPVSQTLSGIYRDLTPTEARVADLIRQGQPTKTIAAFLNTSPSTVEKHRNSIRRKLGLVNKKANLQTYLSSLM